MNKILRAGVILASLTALTIGLVGCTSKKNSDSGITSITSDVETSIEGLPVAVIKVKDYGNITLELYPEIAPNTVNNFIELANSGYYDGLIFHRVIKGFMNQGGCPNGTGTGGPGYSIEGEFSSNGYEGNDLKHTKGVISMARANDPNSAGSQFFIMADTASHLDGQYAAFGKTIDGLDIVEEINSVKTSSADKPVEDVVIEEIRVDTKGIDYPSPEKL